MSEQNQQALKQLEDIQNMMKRSSKFLSLSGLSGICAGVFALIGAAVAYKILNWGNVRFQDYGSIIYKPADNYVVWLLVDGFAVLLLSITSAWYFTRKKAKRLGLKMWDSSAKQLFQNFIIPLLSGAAFAFILIFRHNVISLIAPVTLIFYGLALVIASRHTFDELRYLGILEILLGLLSTYFLGFGLIFWAIGFGILHIIYGIIMYKKHQ